MVLAGGERLSSVTGSPYPRLAHSAPSSSSSVFIFFIFTMPSKADKALKEFIEDIPDSCLAALPTWPGTI